MGILVSRCSCLDLIFFLISYSDIHSIELIHFDLSKFLILRKWIYLYSEIYLFMFNVPL